METSSALDTPEPSTTDTLLLTLDEAAKQLRCPRRSVERYVAGHRLRAVRLGRSVRRSAVLDRARRLYR
ncbi:excisionase family DNA-binding protein [Phycicoccus flavus]|uniref:excisionase family DNA-binding protein n=1 Tax=Phycicoccus flavus TaxID=2502783 RepID=UPI000FEB9105|nr:excisionase family DNA-binding protein [Phycicoccus flavus]NHA68706.1 excisionase family DNA-binding protein [Phycicoccus flavus]